MIQLLHIDCMEYMAKLPDGAFELAIVDPPYGRGEDGGTWAAAALRLPRTTAALILWPAR